jgi:hypothetical protein
MEDSRIKSQDSRIKSQDSRVKSQDSRGKMGIDREVNCIFEVNGFVVRSVDLQKHLNE